MEMPIAKKNRKQITDVINAVQAGAYERTISVNHLLEKADQLEMELKNLDVPAHSRTGCKYEFCNGMKKGGYSYVSTRYCLVRGDKKWELVTFERGKYGYDKSRLVLSEKAALNRKRSFNNI